MRIITHNPYRTLGVYANSTRREIIANRGKASAFLKVGKVVEFPLDLNGQLPPLHRTVEMLDEAEACLAIAKEQIKYAQFWFLKIRPIDEKAFSHITSGYMAYAKEIWSEQDSVSSLQNRLVCSLIENNVGQALQTAEALYTKFGDNYINNVDANSTFQMTGAELLHQFIDTLGEEVGMQQLMGYQLGAKTKAYISSQTVGSLINMISAEVENAKKVDHKDPSARKAAGEKLMAATKEPLQRLRDTLPTNDPQYAMIADKLGLEILQCGIDFFNNSEDYDAARKAMKLQKYAQSIVVGQMSRERCQENVEILHKIIDELPPKVVMAQDKAIKKELAKFVKLPNKVVHAITLLNRTKPHLQSIKRKLGASNKTYLRLSTMVVDSALHNVIEEVNAERKNRFSVEYASILKEAWEAVTIMDEFDMESTMRESRFIPNRNTLKELCDNFIPLSGTEMHMRSIESAIINFKLSNNEGTFMSASSYNIDSVLTLLRVTEQPLEAIRIRTIDAESNDFYLKQTTRIASMALVAIIEIVNNAQKDSFITTMDNGRSLKGLMRKCWDAIELIDFMVVSPDFESYYQKNRNTLKNICSNLGVDNGSGSGLSTSGLSTSNAFVIILIGTILGALCGGVIGILIGIIVGFVIVWIINK